MNIHSKNRIIIVTVLVVLVFALIAGTAFQQSSLLSLKLPEAATQKSTTYAVTPAVNYGAVLSEFTTQPNIVDATANEQPFINPFGDGTSSQSIYNSATVGMDGLLAQVPQRRVSKLYPRGFTYPVSEIGNCRDQQSCFQLCEESSYRQACTILSEKHGFMTPRSTPTVLGAADARDSQLLSYCNSFADCVSYCETRSSDTNCIDFRNKFGNDEAIYLAWKNGFATPELDQYIAQNPATSVGGQSSLYPRVLAANTGFNLDIGDTGSYVQPPSETPIEDCIGQQPLPPTTGPVGGPIPPPDINTSQLAAACQRQFSNFEQGTSTHYQQLGQQGRQQSLDNISSIQSCILNSTNLAADLQNCLRGYSAQ